MASGFCPEDRKSVPTGRMEQKAKTVRKATKEIKEIKETKVIPAVRAGLRCFASIPPRMNGRSPRTAARLGLPREPKRQGRKERREIKAIRETKVTKATRAIKEIRVTRAMPAVPVAPACSPALNSRMTERP